jgi:hypothetical protein
MSLELIASGSAIFVECRIERPTKSVLEFHPRIKDLTSTDDGLPFAQRQLVTVSAPRALPTIDSWVPRCQGLSRRSQGRGMGLSPWNYASPIEIITP